MIKIDIRRNDCMTFPGCSNILLFFFLTLVLVNPSVAQEPHIIPDAHVIDIRSGESNNPGSNMNLFLFSWDDIPGNDTGRFKRILKIGFQIEWLETAKIEKIDGGKTITIFTKENSLLLKLNDEKTRVNLTTNDGRTDNFIATMNNGKLNIYKMFVGNTSIVPKLQNQRVSNNTILNIHKALTFENRVNNINKGTNYSTIQAAIDNASTGDEIHVDSGIYYENVKVTRQLILRGESNLTTIIEGNGSGNVVEVNVNGVTIDGFRIRNGSNGIYVTSSSNVFSNNVLTDMNGVNGVDNTTSGANGGLGGLSSGIYLSGSSNTTLNGNTFGNISGGTGGAGGGMDWDFLISVLGGSGGVSTGLYLNNSPNNTITGNLITNIIGGIGGTVQGVYGTGGSGGLSSGIYLSDSLNNTITGNEIKFLTGGFGGQKQYYPGSGGSGGSSSGIYLSGSVSSTIAGNTISNLSGGIGGEGITEGMSGGPGGSGGMSSGLYLSGSQNNMVKNNLISNITGAGGIWGTWEGSSGGDSSGLYISVSPNNTFSYNMVSNITGGAGAGGIENGGSGGYSSGIILSSSPDNAVVGNTISLLKGGNSGEASEGWSGSGGHSLGILLSSSPDNAVAGNTISYLRGGDGSEYYGGSGGNSMGIYLSDSANNNLTDNSINDTVGGTIGTCYWIQWNCNNGSKGLSVGIDLSISDNNTLSKNNVTLNNDSGVYLAFSSNNMLNSNIIKSNSLGIFLNSSDFNNVTDNNISNSTSVGIKVYETSKNNTISGNKVMNSSFGIFFVYAFNTTASNNIMENNSFNFGVGGNLQSHFDGNNIDSTNLANGRPIYYIIYGKNTIYDGSTKASTLYCILCTNVTFKDMEISNMDRGVYFWSTVNSRIQNITVKESGWGLYLRMSSNNSILNSKFSTNNIFDYYETGATLFSSNNNTFENNKFISNKYGIELSSSNKNTIYNNYFNNTNNFIFTGISYVNTWNTTLKPGKNIVGGLYLGGNFWDNQSGTGFSQSCPDGNGDSICDSKANLNLNNIDHLPLSKNFTSDNMMADMFGVNNSTGTPNTFVLVPVNITNTQNGPIAGIVFDISFDTNILNLTKIRVQRGSLTSAWDSPGFNPDNGKISLVYGGASTEIPDGASGSVVILNFSVVGASGSKSAINISRIQLSDPDGIMGTAPSRNGTFTINNLSDNIPPVAVCGADKLKCENAGAPVQFNGSASYDPDGAIVSYYWDFGDGTNATGAVPKHTYVSHKWNGTGYEAFIADLTVTDNSGFTNKTSQKVVLWMAGDANGDGKVNILDASVIGLKWGGNEPCADLNNDGTVNILDASIIGLNWGKIP